MAIIAELKCPRRDGFSQHYHGIFPCLGRPNAGFFRALPRRFACFTDYGRNRSPHSGDFRANRSSVRGESESVVRELTVLIPFLSRFCVGEASFELLILSPSILCSPLAESFVFGRSAITLRFRMTFSLSHRQNWPLQR
jgi:hypothetical protein